MEEKKGKNKIRLILQILLPVLCALWLAFIIANSLRTGEESTVQSSAVVDTVQKVAQVVAPNSQIANATGEAYDKLHAVIREMAHFMEFAILGALFCWCYLSYSYKAVGLCIPVSLTLFIPHLDEFLQSRVADRAAMLSDVLTDTVGGVTGLIVAGLLVALGVWIGKCKRKKKEKAEEKE